MYRSMNNITFYLIAAAVSKMKPRMKKFCETKISVSKLSFTQYKLQSPVVGYPLTESEDTCSSPTVFFKIFFNCRFSCEPKFTWES
jgi:hypothetical protein